MKKLVSVYLYLCVICGSFVFGLILLMVIGDLIWGKDNSGTFAWPDWYTIIFIFLPILLCVFSALENKKMQILNGQKESKKAEKSVMHKFALQKYMKNLEQRESELNEREEGISALEEKIKLQALKATQEYSKELEEREKKLNEREENISAREEKLNIVANDATTEIESMREYEKALRKTEFTILDWVKRSERKDNEFLEEIQADAEKLKMYKTEMDGYQFEEYVSALMKKNGFQSADVTQKSQDFGADIVGEKDGVKYVVQCKYYSSMVGIEAVQQVYSSKFHYGAHVAVVATNNVFTKAAKTLAGELKVLLWDCEDIAKMA